MSCVYSKEAPRYLRQGPAVDTLRRVWIQQYVAEDGFDGQNPIKWRKTGSLPPAAQMISSPYDLDVRHAKKRGMQWKGYKLQITETCDPNQMLATCERRDHRVERA